MIASLSFMCQSAIKSAQNFHKITLILYKDEPTTYKHAYSLNWLCWIPAKLQRNNENGPPAVIWRAVNRLTDLVYALTSFALKHH